MSRSDFWSERKARVRAEAKAAEQAEADKAQELQEAEHEAQPDAEILAELNLPDPDSLEQGDDFSAFLSKTVPERIRNRALRRLWRSNPVLANLDSLVDYGEDFTDAATVLPDMQTVYQVGKGMLQAVLDDPEAEPDAPNGPAQQISVETAEVSCAATALEAPTTKVQLEPSPPVVESETMASAPSVRRRMRFEFDPD